MALVLSVLMRRLLLASERRVISRSSSLNSSARRLSSVRMRTSSLMASAASRIVFSLSWLIPVEDRGGPRPKTLGQASQLGLTEGGVRCGIVVFSH